MDRERRKLSNNTAFFSKTTPWGLLNWELAKVSLKSSASVILIAGDATTVTKSGKCTFGLGKFFSSIYSRCVPGLGFQTLSLIDVGTRKSWPILAEQMQPKTPKKLAKKKSTRGRGRPVGSKNKNRRQVELNVEMKQVQAMLRKLLVLISDTLEPIFFVYDGAFGNNAAAQMTRQVDLHLISKLKRTSALYFPWEGIYSGRGRKPIYGDKIDYASLPEKHLTLEETEDGIKTTVYQCKMRHKNFPDQLNVVIIAKENLKTGKLARVILFSTDLELGWENIIDYYRLRFQIEFNFRDAKQHWGLEDFMVIKEKPVYNSANLSFFMVNLSQRILSSSSEVGILDLKARFHALRYVKEVFKILPKNTDPIIIEQLIEKVPVLGRVHEIKRAA